MKTLAKIYPFLMLLIFLPFTLFARTGDVSYSSWHDWQEYGVLDNCNAVALNASNTCGPTGGFRTEGFGWLQLEVDYVYDAGTGWELFLEQCSEGHLSTNCTDAADWYRVPSQKTIINTGTEYGTNKIFQTTSADSKFVLTIPIKYRRMRIVGFQASGSPTASDLGTISATVFND